MASFTITINGSVNLPPATIGDGTQTTDYGTVLVYTTADFTSNTTPPYSDPEGDAALNLKVLSLPVTGVLKYDSILVTTNQIISFADIALGKFTYTPDNSVTTSYNSAFTFTIADAGSGEFYV